MSRCITSTPSRTGARFGRSAGAAVSVGNRIYLIGGVVPSPNSPDPINRSISTTASVIYLDTTESPLRWRTAPSLRESREHFNAVYADGRTWVFQGRNERSTHLRGVESLAVGYDHDRGQATVAACVRVEYLGH